MVWNTSKLCRWKANVYMQLRVGCTQKQENKRYRTGWYGNTSKLCRSKENVYLNRSPDHACVCDPAMFVKMLSSELGPHGGKVWAEVCDVVCRKTNNTYVSGRNPNSNPMYILVEGAADCPQRCQGGVHYSQLGYCPGPVHQPRPSEQRGA